LKNFPRSEEEMKQALAAEGNTGLSVPGSVAKRNKCFCPPRQACKTLKKYKALKYPI